MSISNEKIIEQTTNWIKSVVIDCNFCPFAAKAILKKKYSLYYKIKCKHEYQFNCIKRRIRLFRN